MNRKRRSLISAAPSTGPLEGTATLDDEPDDDERSDALRTERFTEDEPPSASVAGVDLVEAAATEPEFPPVPPVEAVVVEPAPVEPVEPAPAEPVEPVVVEPVEPVVVEPAPVEPVATKAPAPSPLPTSFDTPAPAGGVRDEGWFVGTGAPSPERREQPELDLEPTLHPAKQNLAPMLVVGVVVVGLVLLLIMALSLG